MHPFHRGVLLNGPVHNFTVRSIISLPGPWFCDPVREIVAPISLLNNLTKPLTHLYLQYSPFLATMFLFGLAMVGMINSTFYTKLETSFFSFIDVIEKGLERIHRDRQTHGYATFLVSFLCLVNVQLINWSLINSRLIGQLSFLASLKPLQNCCISGPKNWFSRWHRVWFKRSKIDWNSSWS